MSSSFPRWVCLLLFALSASALWADGGGGGASADDPAKQSGPYKDAMTAIQAGRYGQAAVLLESWVAQYSNDADGHNWLAYTYRKTGRLDLAFRHYRRALGIDPQHRGAHEYIGEAYLLASQPEMAEQHAKILAQLCPQSCEELSDLRSALAAYRANPPKTAARAP